MYSLWVAEFYLVNTLALVVISFKPLRTGIKFTTGNLVNHLG